MSKTMTRFMLLIVGRQMYMFKMNDGKSSQKIPLKCLFRRCFR